jgi:hypothetical protein
MFDFAERDGDDPDLPAPDSCGICPPEANCPPCMCNHCRLRRRGAVNTAIETAIALGRYDQCLTVAMLRRSRLGFQ